MTINPTDHPGPVDASNSLYARWKPLDLSKIHLRDGFWAQRQTVSRTESLRHAYEMLEKAGNFHNFRLAAGVDGGEYIGRNFIDTDVYKWLEAAAWELGNGPDPELQSMAESAIQLVAAAQMPDGYLVTYYQTAEPAARWADLDHSHELYSAGHLFQAAVAMARAVKDDRLLTVACRFADHICDTFGPGRRQTACGHPEVEMALVELYRTTGNRRYLDQAAFFIDQRGQNRMVGFGPYGPEYHQDHLPVREVKEATGHAVRQLYLATGIMDVYLETGEDALLNAMRLLSEDIRTSKTLITGGMGSRFDGEGFGDPYELPSDQCYCETCAAIASVMWNWRMLLATGQGCYADLIERALFNNILASPALDGRHFFYINPLMLREARFLRLSNNPPPSQGYVPIERPVWHDVSCCPPNVMRLVASIRHYLSTTTANSLQIHQFASADFTFSPADGSKVRLAMSTAYPWQGRVELRIDESSPAAWDLAIRQPGWCAHPRLSVNGQPVDASARDGYLHLERVWYAGDVVELDLGMKPTLIRPNPRVDAVRASLAIQQGPLVYCLEACDQEPQTNLLDVQLDQDVEMESSWQPDLLGGINIIEAAGRRLNLSSWQGSLYRPWQKGEDQTGQPIRLRAVPYYTWGNRGIGPMRVWIPQKED